MPTVLLDAFFESKTIGLMSYFTVRSAPCAPSTLDAATHKTGSHSGRRNAPAITARPGT